ncbi:hypothetical protein pb186bvf_000549 [Paramecium bursaria]
MSKHSGVKYDYQSYHQSYIPQPFVGSNSYIQQVPQYSQIYQPTQIIQGEPIILPSVKKVVQGETITHNSHKDACCDDCAKGWPCQSQQQVVTRKVQYKPVVQQVPNVQIVGKVDELEKIHQQEIKEIEQRFQSQLDSFIQQKNQEDQAKQFGDLKQTILDLKSQINQPQQYPQNSQFQSYQSQQHLYELEKLERELSKKKNKIKNLKVYIDTLKQDNSSKNQMLNEYEVRLQQQEQILRLPPKETFIQVPTQQGPPTELISRIQTLEREREDLIRELGFSRGDLQQIDTLKNALSSTSQENATLQQNFSRLMNDYKYVEQENIKLNTIVTQKDELIKSLEQRISVELSRQSMLLQQNNPSRVVVEQTTRPIQQQYILQQQPQTQYVLKEVLTPIQQTQSQPTIIVTDQQKQPYQSITQYVLKDAPQVIQPTLQQTIQQGKL